MCVCVCVCVCLLSIKSNLSMPLPAQKNCTQVLPCGSYIILPHSRKLNIYMLPYSTLKGDVNNYCIQQLRFPLNTITQHQYNPRFFGQMSFGKLTFG
jgi:hypothetical protein